MLYEVITRITSFFLLLGHRLECTKTNQSQLALFFGQLLNNRFNQEINNIQGFCRITSYNVCYTKLLRSHITYLKKTPENTISKVRMINTNKAHHKTTWLYQW